MAGTACAVLINITLNPPAIFFCRAGPLPARQNRRLQAFHAIPTKNNAPHLCRFMTNSIFAVQCTSLRYKCRRNRKILARRFCSERKPPRALIELQEYADIAYSLPTQFELDATLSWNIAAAARKCSSQGGACQKISCARFSCYGKSPLVEIDEWVYPPHVSAISCAGAVIHSY